MTTVFHIINWSNLKLQYLQTNAWVFFQNVELCWWNLLLFQSFHIDFHLSPMLPHWTQVWDGISRNEKRPETHRQLEQHHALALGNVYDTRCPACTHEKKKNQHWNCKGKWFVISTRKKNLCKIAEQWTEHWNGLYTWRSHLKVLDWLASVHLYQVKCTECCSTKQQYTRNCWWKTTSWLYRKCLLFMDLRPKNVVHN